MCVCLGGGGLEGEGWMAYYEVQLLQEMATAAQLHMGIIDILYYSHFREQENESLQLLFSGKWSKLGCETNFSLESTVCRCNHLTHFAILLSARPLDLPRPKVLALQITGYLGVSVSLVAMAATVFVFVFLK